MAGGRSEGGRPWARGRTTPGFLGRVLDIDGVERPVVTWVPPDYDGASDFPLIVFLHGRGEEGRDGWKQAAVGLGPAIMLDVARWPFLAVFPQKPADRLGWLEHERLVLESLDLMRREFRVDPRRIHLTGVSMGGFGSWMIAPRHRDIFASIAPICGGGNPRDADRLVGLPIWAFHGAADPVVAPSHSERMVRAVRNAGGEARLTLYEDVGHPSWDMAYRGDQLADWFGDQVL